MARLVEVFRISLILSFCLLLSGCKKTDTNNTNTEYLYFDTESEFDQFFGFPMNNQIWITGSGNLKESQPKSYNFNFNLQQINDIPLCGQAVVNQSEIIETQQGDLAFFTSGFLKENNFMNKFQLIANNGNSIYELKIPTSEKVEINTLIETGENRFFLVGRIFNSNIQNFDYLIIAIDRFKNTFELKTWEAPQNEGFSDIVFDGNHLVVYGYQQILGVETRNLTLHKLDLNLNILKSKTFDFEGYQESQDLLMLPNQQFVITAHSSETDPLHNILIMRLTSDFEIVWKKEVGEERHEGPEVAIFDSYGNIVIAARTNSYGEDYQKALLVKLSSEGELLSTHSFINQIDTYPNSIFEYHNSLYLVGRILNSSGKKELVAIKHSNSLN